MEQDANINLKTYKLLRLSAMFDCNLTQNIFFVHSQEFLIVSKKILGYAQGTFKLQNVFLSEKLKLLKLLY